MLRLLACFFSSFPCWCRGSAGRRLSSFDDRHHRAILLLLYGNARGYRRHSFPYLLVSGLRLFNDFCMSAPATLNCVAKNAMLGCDSMPGRRRYVFARPPTPARCSSGLRALGSAVLSASPGLRLSLTCQDARGTHEIRQSPPN